MLSFDFVHLNSPIVCQRFLLFFLLLLSFTLEAISTSNTVAKLHAFSFFTFLIHFLATNEIMMISLIVLSF